MTLLLKSNLEANKMKALLGFLNSWGIETEIISSDPEEKTFAELSYGSLSKEWNSTEDQDWDQLLLEMPTI
jgi:hypothetical protein